MRIGGLTSLAVLTVGISFIASPVLANCGLARTVSQAEAAVESVLNATTLAGATEAGLALATAIRAAEDASAGDASAARYLSSRRDAVRLLEAGDAAGARAALASSRELAGSLLRAGGEDCIENEEASPLEPASAASEETAALVAAVSPSAGALNASSGRSASTARSLPDRISGGKSVDWSSAFADTSVFAPIVGGLTLLTFFGAIYSLFQERRTDKRYLCYLPVEVSRDSQRAESAMLDVNRTGARVVIENLSVKPGDSVAISIGGKLRNAVVIWSKKGRAGVRFERALATRDLRSIESIARAGAGFERVENA